MASIYSLWGASLYFGLFGIFGAALFASGHDFGVEFFVLLAAGAALFAASVVLYLRKRKKDASRRVAYEKWNAEKFGRAGE
ncbi:LPXTG cell wall anchor domain-containing protein [Micromonospora sp. NBC_01813]|uniref:LPXTG cell wall anchor domain-containing protein n=1 Tax=Micromonospora sp. NBC_01813 TaxID=2975988 RepID=UPI002DDAABD2|nr:LPXTG cell wall anchor domain-containing protein [Micromonospora sp. NBC_01813]WSA08658.1 LPXTG cell wall anchor domain-containing protein [Micromonospora sp. NBC_01813]